MATSGPNNLPRNAYYRILHKYVENVCLYVDLYIPPYRINNEKIFTPTKEAVLKQPRTVKAEQ